MTRLKQALVIALGIGLAGGHGGAWLLAACGLRRPREQRPRNAGRQRHRFRSAQWPAQESRRRTDTDGR